MDFEWEWSILGFEEISWAHCFCMYLVIYCQERNGLSFKNWRMDAETSKFNDALFLTNTRPFANAKQVARITPTKLIDKLNLLNRFMKFFFVRVVIRNSNSIQVFMV